MLHRGTARSAPPTRTETIVSSWSYRAPRIGMLAVFVLGLSACGAGAGGSAAAGSGGSGTPADGGGGAPTGGSTGAGVAADRRSVRAAASGAAGRRGRRGGGAPLRQGRHRAGDTDRRRALLAGRCAAVRVVPGDQRKHDEHRGDDVHDHRRADLEQGADGLSATPGWRRGTFDPGSASFGLWIYSDQKTEKYNEGGNTINGDYDCVDAGRVRDGADGARVPGAISVPRRLVALPQ